MEGSKFAFFFCIVWADWFLLSTLQIFFLNCIVGNKQPDETFLSGMIVFGFQFWSPKADCVGAGSGIGSGRAGYGSHIVYCLLFVNGAFCPSLSLLPCLRMAPLGCNNKRKIPLPV